jgi:hypothetical protein
MGVQLREKRAVYGKDKTIEKWFVENKGFCFVGQVEKTIK